MNMYCYVNVNVSDLIIYSLPMYVMHVCVVMI